MNRITDTLQDQMSSNVRYVRPVPVDSATGLTSDVYRQLQEDFMVGPVLTLHSPLPEVLAGVWSALRESLMSGHANRTTKEAVAATVSKINECPFCIDAHTTMLHASAAHDVANAILRGDFDHIQEPTLRAHVRWALAGQTPDPPEPVQPPFACEDGPEFLGTVLTFHYINRMANVFLGDSFLPVPAPIKDVTRYLFGSLACKPYIRPLPPGKSLRLVPKANLPEDLAWAAGNPAVAGALAGLVEVVETAGRWALPERVRNLVKLRIHTWKGEPVGISRRWVEDMLVGLPIEHRPAARLALLTALASYQVDDKVIADFKAQCPEDAQLIAVTAWASLTAARRIGLWLAEPFYHKEV